jgi:LacI family transcriptional regulator, galactose operon repressor
MFRRRVGEKGKRLEKQKTPTLDDVAALAGVSTATVSRTLNFPDKVRDATRQQVDEAVQALGYSPHFGARYLASNRTNTVGAVIPTMDNAIFAHALQALQEELAKSGVTLLVATSQYDPAQEEAQIRALMARGVDGMVLIGQRRSDAIYETLRARGVPYVVLWTAPSESEHPSAGFSNYRAANAIACEVLAQGHTRIAMIAGHTSDNDRAAERVRGVTAALEAAGLTLAPPYYAETNYSFDCGAAEAALLFDLPQPPTAIICGNDVLAAGVVREARQRRLALPADISVVGFDDIDLAQVIDPPLTTVRVPHKRMGAASARMLVRMIRHEGQIESVEFDAQIVHRASLGPVPRAGGDRD